MYPLYLSDFNETWVARQIFEKNILMSIFMKICPVEAELWHAEGQTDRPKDSRTDGRIDIHYEAISRFSQSLNAPTERLIHVEHCISV
jgi:hypothetical protein